MSTQKQMEQRTKGQRAKRKPELNRIEALVAKAHNPALATKHPDMVYVLFDDGEIALTKCGHLLWDRTLHLIEHSLHVSFGAFPVKFREHTCAFVTEEDGVRIREEMRQEYPKITGKKAPSEQMLHLKAMRNLMISLSDGSSNFQEVIEGYEAEIEAELEKA